MIESLNRADWSAVVAAFVAFFGGLGTVEQSDDEVAFAADGTGLALSRDGSSRSFMPLHALEAGWDVVVFDNSDHEVKLMSGATTYTYRVPARLLASKP